MNNREPKSVDLEALVRWAIMVQRADRDDVALHGVELAAHLASRSRCGADASDHPAAWPADSLVRLGDIAAVGARIDGGRAVRGVAPRLHPDAESVVAVIDRMRDGRRRGLVLHYARIGERPDWLCWEQRLVPLPAESGAGRGVKHKVAGEWQPAPERSEIARRYVAQGLPIVDRHGRSILEREERGFAFRRDPDGRREQLVRWCPVVAEPSIDEIRIVNDTYAQWHAGMMWLLGELVGAPLRDHRVTGFLAPSQPWNQPRA